MKGLAMYFGSEAIGAFTSSSRHLACWCFPPRKEVVFFLTLEVLGLREYLTANEKTDHRLQPYQPGQAAHRSLSSALAPCADGTTAYDSPRPPC